MAGLKIIATPIGNMGDLSTRAREVLQSVEIIACEDTRKTGLLLARLGIVPRPRLISYHEHNEERATGQIAAFLSEGLTVGLCSNAGYPGISDPGYRVIQAAIAGGHPLEVIPGACAIEPALLLSGLPASSFLFKGFAPRKPGPRRRFLEQEREQVHTLIFYESPHRVHKLLGECLEIYGDRPAAVCREVTKKYEQVLRGTLSELRGEIGEGKLRGEVTVVVGGQRPVR